MKRRNLFIFVQLISNDAKISSLYQSIREYNTDKTNKLIWFELENGSLTYEKP